MSNEFTFRTKEISLPSGASVTIRGMKGREMNIFTDKKEMKDGEGVNKVAKSCVVKASEGFDYDTALQGDRYAIIVNIRIMTYKEKYKFKSECPHCEENGSYEIDLTELDVKNLDGRPTTGLEFKLPIANRKLTYHLPTGKDEKELMKIQKNFPGQLFSASMLVYTDKIENEKMKTSDFFLDLEAEDIIAFQEDLDSKNCGVDTELELECPSCYKKFEMELPITKDFFLPKNLKK